MSKRPIIAGIGFHRAKRVGGHALVFAAVAAALMTFAASEARAGVMVPDDIDSAVSDGMVAAAPTQEQPTESPDRADSKLLATQPAHSGAGASGSATSASGGLAPVAVLTVAIFETTLEPFGFCLELKNSQLPSPPASDLLRPPKHAG